MNGRCPKRDYNQAHIIPAGQTKCEECGHEPSKRWVATDGCPGEGWSVTEREQEPTPGLATLPWLEDPDHPSRILPTVRTPGSRVVVEVHHRDDMAEVQAIRAFVVRAVNLHEDLLEALLRIRAATCDIPEANCAIAAGIAQEALEAAGEQ